jgi:PPOX class probable F420-dependent enzyme
MGIRLTPTQAWDVIAASHTGILTTLRRDGTPVTLPVWFVVDQCTIAMMTPSGTKKVSRIRRDPRASFLVESGQRWEELRAVHLTGRVEVVDDSVAIARIGSAFNAKYTGFRPAGAALPTQTQNYYANQTILRFTPEDRMLTWDNARIPLR